MAAKPNRSASRCCPEHRQRSDPARRPSRCPRRGKSCKTSPYARACSIIHVAPESVVRPSSCEPADPRGRGTYGVGGHRCEHSGRLIDPGRPPSVVCNSSPPTVQPLLTSANETSIRLKECKADRWRVQVAPPSIVFRIFPPSPTVHPIWVPGTKRTEPNQLPPPGCATDVQVLPPFVLRKIESRIPLTATRV